MVQVGFHEFTHCYWEKAHCYDPVFLLESLLVFESAQFIVEMHPDVSEEVLVDVNSSVAASSWDDLLLLLVEDNVFLELLRDADYLLIGEVGLDVAASNLGQVTLLLHLEVLL